MASDQNENVDAKLSEAFAPDAAAAARIASRALAARPVGIRRAGLRISLAFTALCLALAVWLSRPLMGPPPPGPGVGVSELSGSLVDDVLILSIPDGAIVISGPDRRYERPPDGFGIVFVEGGVR